MDEKPSKWQKFKSWAYDHQEDLTIAGFFATMIAFVGGLSYLVYKDEKAQVEEYNRQVAEQNAKASELKTWINSELEAGNDVYQLGDGHFLTIPHDAPQKHVLR